MNQKKNTQLNESIKLPIENYSLTVQNQQLICINDSTGEIKEVEGKKEDIYLSLFRMQKELSKKPILLYCFVCGKEIIADRNRKEPTCSDKCRKKKQYMKKQDEELKKETLN